MAMFGIGPVELLIVGLMCFAPLAAAIVAVVVFVVKRDRNHRSAFPSNLEPCPDCGRMVSMQALACPGCGRPRDATYPPPKQ